MHTDTYYCFRTIFLSVSYKVDKSVKNDYLKYRENVYSQNASVMRLYVIYECV